MIFDHRNKFIEVATGQRQLVDVGHTLFARTQDISVVKLSSHVESDICFVDTPGFDDTNNSDFHTLKKISEFLNKTYVIID